MSIVAEMCLCVTVSVWARELRSGVVENEVQELMAGRAVALNPKVRLEGGGIAQPRSRSSITYKNNGFRVLWPLLLIALIAELSIGVVVFKTDTIEAKKRSK